MTRANWATHFRTEDGRRLRRKQPLSDCPICWGNGTVRGYTRSMCGTIVYYDKSLPCLCMCREKGPVSPEFAATLRKGRGLINTNAKRYLKRSFGDQTFRIANIRAAFNMPRADWETFENTAWLKKVGPDAYRLA